MTCSNCKYCQKIQDNKMNWVCVEELYRVDPGTPVCVNQISLNDEICKRFQENVD